MAVDLSKYVGQYPPQVLTAVQSLFVQKPDQEQSFINNYGGDLKSFLDATVGWWDENGAQVAGKLDEFQPELQLLGSLGFSPNPTIVTAAGGVAPGNQPAEQVLGNYVLGLGQSDIANDQLRQDYANNLIARYAGANAGTAATIASLQPTVIDAGTQYFQANPDVAAAFNGSADGPAPGIKLINGQPMTAQQFALWHYQNYGQKEGREAPHTIQQNSAMLQSELAASADAQNKQLGALSEQLASLSTNLSGNLQAKAANLAQQMAALTAANSQFTADQKATLAKQVADQLGNLEAEVNTKRDAIATELQTMGQGITAQDQARRAALETELTKLNAAQAPLNAARIAGANTIGSAVNLASQAAQDQIRARMAQQGYIGSSTGSDMAIARVAIGGRQQAAEALANANIANASDTAAIGKYGATKEFGIADTTAGQTQALTNFGATENRTLSDFGATQRRGISDFGTNTKATIENNDATNRLNLAGYGAGQTRTLGDFGADATRTIADYGAGEKRNIKDSAAGRDLSFFSNDIQRRLSTLNLPNQAIIADLQTQNAADEYGQSGLRRTLANLGFFQPTGGNAPSVQNPPMVQPVNSGLDNIGAGLVSLGGSIGNANNWWASPSRAGVGAPTTYDNFVRTNPTSSAATGSFTVPRVEYTNPWAASTPKG